MSSRRRVLGSGSILLVAMVAMGTGAAGLGGALGCGPLSTAPAASIAPPAPGVRPSPAQVAQALASPSVDDLIGLWAVDFFRGPMTTGPIDLVFDGPTVRVTANGVVGSCAGRQCLIGDDDHHLYVLPGAVKPGTVEALWSQKTDPFIARGGYVSPVVLTDDGKGHYRGVAPLLPLRMRLVLAISKRPSGEVTAFVRERERNLGRLLGSLTVKRTGNAVQLVGSDFTMPATLVADSAAADGLAIDLPLPETDITLHLTRRSRGDALVAEFFPEPPAPYLPPPAKDDGWQVAAAPDVGASVAPLERFAADIARLVPSAYSDLALHNVVVAKKGKLIFERAFLGGATDELHDVRSAGKSFSTTLLGTAVDRRELSLDDFVLNVLGETSADARWKRLKVRHLASMSTGLDCDDENNASPGSEDVVQDGKEPNWYKAFLALPMVAEPGSRSVYCTMGINLLGDLLEQRSSPQKGLPVWLPELFVTRLARPLQMTSYHLNSMPTGQGYLGGGLRLQPRDMAKLGQLYLAKGIWNGQRILSPAWTTVATARHAALTDPDDYGLGFWRRTFSYDRTTYSAFYASGNGGQLIITIPALEAVIVFTAGNYANRRTWGRLLDDYVPRYLIPALLGRP